MRWNKEAAETRPESTSLRQFLYQFYTSTYIPVFTSFVCQHYTDIKHTTDKRITLNYGELTKAIYLLNQLRTFFPGHKALYKNIVADTG